MGSSVQMYKNNRYLMLILIIGKIHCTCGSSSWDNVAPEWSGSMCNLYDSNLI